MQFEEQSAAIRQMKELLRDQAKFRAKLDRVVRKIETSSERTAKLADRNKARAQKMKENAHARSAHKRQASEHAEDGEDHSQKEDGELHGHGHDGEHEEHSELTSVPGAS